KPEPAKSLINPCPHVRQLWTRQLAVVRAIRILEPESRGQRTRALGSWGGTSCVARGVSPHEGAGRVAACAIESPPPRRAREPRIESPVGAERCPDYSVRCPPPGAQHVVASPSSCKVRRKHCWSAQSVPAVGRARSIASRASPARNPSPRRA